MVVDPGERAQRRVVEVPDESGIVRPAPDLREQDQVQRCRVDRAVVGLEPVPRRLPRRTSWTILPGSASMAGLSSVACRLASTSRALRASSGPNISVCRHVISVSRPKTVMNHGIPRPAGCRALASMDAERGEIGDRARERVVEVVPGGAELRDAQLPGGERGLDTLPLLAEAPLGRRGLICSPSRRARPRRRCPRRCAGLELDPVAGLAQLDVAPASEDTWVRAWPWSSSSTNWFSDSSKCASASGAGACSVAEREVVVLDREDVREVVAELERELERDRAHRVVVHDQFVLHALADEAVPGDRDGVLRQLTGDRVPQEEGGE